MQTIHELDIKRDVSERYMYMVCRLVTYHVVYRWLIYSHADFSIRTIFYYRYTHVSTKQKQIDGQLSSIHQREMTIKCRIYKRRRNKNKYIGISCCVVVTRSISDRYATHTLTRHSKQNS